LRPCGRDTARRGEREEARQIDGRFLPDVQREPHLSQDSGGRGCAGPQDLDDDQIHCQVAGQVGYIHRCT